MTEKEEMRLSPTVARVLLDRSPLHAWQIHRLGGGKEQESTKATERGKLVECLVMGTEIDRITIVDAKDWRTSAAKEQRDAARAKGLLPVLVEDYNNAENIAENIREGLKVRGIAFVGESQVRVEWSSAPIESSGPGVPCSGVLDHLIIANGRAQIYDLKTTENANPGHIQRAITQYGYHLQHAAYIEAIEKKHPELAGRIDFAFLFCEVEAPYSVVVAELAGSMRELGERQWQRAVGVWGRCLAMNRWHDYGVGPVRIEAAPWQISQEDEQLAKEVEP